MRFGVLIFLDTKDRINWITIMEPIVIEQYSSRNDFRIEELLEIANDLIEDIAPSQPSDRVSKSLTERTLRYYISKGLVDKPSGKEGVSALYEYRHLLQILAVKRLQASFLPVKTIEDMLTGLDSGALLKIIMEPGVDVKKAPLNDAMAFLDSLAGSSRSSRFSSRSHGSVARKSRRDSSRLLSRGKKGTDHEAWNRYPLADGLELHVRRGKGARFDVAEIVRMVEKILE